MPVFVEIVGDDGRAAERVFDLFRSVDERFSTYKEQSEISRINRGEIRSDDYSGDMRAVLQLAEDTKRVTNGFFDIKTPQGELDPSGLVKGWAINKAAHLLRKMGYDDFYLEVGGDIQTSGRDASGIEWRIGIRDPEVHESIVKVVEPRGKGVATSGTAARGAHIWDPHAQAPARSLYRSITVIGPDIYEADRFATAAFAMGEHGPAFIESLPGFEAYAVAEDRTAVKTSGFSRYVV